MTRVTTIPGNFNTGVTLDDLLLKFPDLAVNIDAGSVLTSPSVNYSGEQTITNAIDVSTAASYAAKDLAGHYTAAVNGVESAKYIDAQDQPKRRAGYALPNNFFTGKNAITMFAVVKSRKSADTYNHQIFSGYHSNSSKPMLAFGFSSNGVVTLAARHSDEANTVDILDAACSADTWLPLIAVVDYTGNRMSLEIVGSNLVQKSAFAGFSGASGTPAGAGCGFLGRHNATSYLATAVYRNSWKKALKYDRLLTAKELEIARRSLKATADRLNATGS
ncbi:hypothetical protein [Halopseudomonas sp.]|uniref:hypothetical protein n=1 Tax=Halopseudomonas sp. TaxID=2901191 RepID=UPI0030036E82